MATMKTSLLALVVVLGTSSALAEDAPAAPASAATAPSGAADVAPSLNRFELATGVEAREPVGAASEFSAGTRVFAFLDVQNPGADTELVVTFEREGGARSPGVTLSVPSGKRYRTHAFYSHTRAAGTYKCIVSTKDGTVVAEKTFAVSAAPAAS
jgi:hypothetical protein